MNIFSFFNRPAKEADHTFTGQKCWCGVVHCMPCFMRSATCATREDAYHLGYADAGKKVKEILEANKALTPEVASALKSNRIIA